MECTAELATIVAFQRSDLRDALGQRATKVHDISSIYTIHIYICYNMLYDG